jgi:type IV secretion system protein VirD4
VGGSGTGKSFSFFLPNLAFARGVSCVVTDPKGELWQHTAGFHPSVRYAPTEPEASACLNWIPLCKNARLAELCARAIVEAGATERQEAPWPDLETAFLSSLFAHASTLSVPTPLAAYHLFTQTEPARLLEMFLASPSPVAREQAIIFGQTHERMRGSIVPVVAAKLQFLRSEAVARFTSASLTPPDFGRLRLCPTAVYWCAREQDMALLRPLSSLFFTLLLEQIAAEPVTAGTGSVPVHLFLDEFANIGVIPHFDSTISLARGRGVGVWLGVQSLSQLEQRTARPTPRPSLPTAPPRSRFPAWTWRRPNTSAGRSGRRRNWCRGAPGRRSASR